jgi:hypothetical protein
MWSTTLGHMAISGPAPHDHALREFEEHPDHKRAGEDPMIDYEALADVIGFLAVGDLVLSALASTLLGRWEVSGTYDNPWQALMNEVDSRASRGDRTPVLGAARELDLDLREARHRIAAHRRPDHMEILEWDADDLMGISLTNPALTRVDPEVLVELGLEQPLGASVGTDAAAHPADVVVGLLREADGLLAEAMSADPRLRMHARPHRETAETTVEIRDLFDRLHYHARLLDGEGRRLVRQAHWIAGYETVRPSRVVVSAIRATAEVTAARDPA